MHKRLKEIEARLAAINTEIDSAEGEALTALSGEADELLAERTQIMGEIQSRQDLRGRIAAGTEPGITVVDNGGDPNEAEQRAAAFVSSGRMTVDTAEARSVLISSGNIVAPTAVSGINDIEGAHVSSILELVTVADCEGMSCNRVAYIDEDAAAADEQTEGSAATAKEVKFDYVDIKPTSIAVTAQISKQAKKQTPLAYEAKVREQAHLSLRKKAVSKLASAIKVSELVETVDAAVTGGKGKIDATTLRKLVFAYGGDEGVSGNAYLLLNKKDLIAFGDVRGTNEKKAVYEIIPDAANNNTGIIKEGGLSARYCLMKDLEPYDGAAQGEAAVRTMFFGNPRNIELDLFSKYEIQVSSDFAFTSLMDTILGDAELGCDLTVKNGLVALTVPAAPKQ